MRMELTGRRRLSLVVTMVLLGVSFVVPVCPHGCTEEPMISGPDRRVDDYQLTASQSYHEETTYDHSPARSRLNATQTSSPKAVGAWCASDNVLGQWIQVDFRKRMYITTIATKGRQGTTWRQRVTSYEIKYSQNGLTWANYTEGGENKVFRGNHDQECSRDHVLQEPFSARFVRLYPLTWVNHMSLRWELYGCLQSGSGCRETALINGPKFHVLDEQLTSTSSWTSHDHGPRRSRLDVNETRSPKKRAGAWCVYRNQKGHWIQVDFEEEVNVTAISTKGRQSIKQWVTSYRVMYSTDSLTWTWYAEDGVVKEFVGNTDFETEVKDILKTPFSARFLRLYPTGWHHHICLRWEVYGCPFTVGGEGEVTQTVTAGAGLTAASVPSDGQAASTPSAGGAASVPSSALSAGGAASVPSSALPAGEAASAPYAGDAQINSKHGETAG